MHGACRQEAVRHCEEYRLAHRRGGVERIAELYAVEKEARGKHAGTRVAIRKEKAEPIFDDLKAWLHQTLPQLLGKGELAKAIRYSLAA